MSYNQFYFKCINHGCQLNNACQHYHNIEGEEKYIRPQESFNGFNKPKLRCYFLLPFNTNYIVKQSKMNDEFSAKKKSKLKFKIVEKFGGDKKVELMTYLNALISLC